MLVLSLLFFTVVTLLIFSLTKDTGKNTKHARQDTPTYIQKLQEDQRTVNTGKVVKVS